MPAARSEVEFDAVGRDEARLRPGVEELCRRLRISAHGLARLPGGSLPVYGTDLVVLKLFPPVYASERAVEVAALEAVADRLPLPTPRPLCAGEHQDWEYVLMERLPGRSLDGVWPTLRLDQREQLAAQVGRALRALHLLPAPELGDRSSASWRRFVLDQRATAATRQSARGLPASWCAQVPAYLDAVELDDDRRVLLHTEVMPANLLVVEDAHGRAVLSGLVDFEPARIGSGEYDLVAVGLFLGEGHATVLRAALHAYGYDQADLDGALSRRLLAWTLLHEHSDLAALLPRLPPPAEPTLTALARSWFPSG